MANRFHISYSSGVPRDARNTTNLHTKDRPAKGRLWDSLWAQDRGFPRELESLSHCVRERKTSKKQGGRTRSCSTVIQRSTETNSIYARPRWGHVVSSVRKNLCQKPGSGALRELNATLYLFWYNRRRLCAEVQGKQGTPDITWRKQAYL